MKRDVVIAALKRHAPELKQLGVVSLSLFGSTARDEATDQSDIDVAVRLERIEGGLAYFGRLAEIERRLQRILKARVDVVPEPAPKPGVQKAIEQDRVLAF
jgi:predicted nucleotidyltransferase